MVASAHKQQGARGRCHVGMGAMYRPCRVRSHLTNPRAIQDMGPKGKVPGGQWGHDPMMPEARQVAAQHLCTST